MKIKPLILIIDPKEWKQFKLRIPRSMTLNDAVVKLIRDFNKNKVPTTDTSQFYEYKKRGVINNE